MKEILLLLSQLFLRRFTPSAPTTQFNCKNSVLKGSAYVCLIVAYVLGCKGLYYHLLPLWGAELSLWGISVLLIITSGLLCLIAWFLRPKVHAPKEIIGDWMKKVNDIKPAEVSKQFFSLISSKPAATFLTVAALTYFYLHSKKSSSKSLFEI